MIEVKNISKSFKGKPVLQGVSLNVEEGEILTLIGGSGKGKSVLMRTIIGLLKPDSGEVLIDGKNIHKLRGKKLRELKNNFGVVFQTSALFDSMNVYDNIAFPLREKTRLKEPEIAKKIQSALQSVDLIGCDEKFPAELSGGMRKRVAIARCLVMQPRAIIFDEPTTGLDPIMSRVIHDLIAHLQKKYNLTAIIVSHEIPNIFRIVNKVAMLHDGKILLHGTPDQFTASNDEIIKKFLNGEIE